MASSRERLGILISGGGTTMQEIVKASQSGELPLYVGVVVASSRFAGGIEKAHKLGIPVEVVEPNTYKGGDGKVDQLGFGDGILRSLRKYSIDRVSQNGWTPMTPDNVIEEFEGDEDDYRITNQHPALLPDFGGKGMYGKRAHAATILFRKMTNGELVTEATAQAVSKGEYDGGTVFANSESVSFLKSDSVEDLAAKVLPVEHRVQISMLKDAAAGKLVKVTRQSILVPGQETILELAKRMAGYLYPHG